MPRPRSRRLRDCCDVCVCERARARACTCACESFCPSVRLCLCASVPKSLSRTVSPSLPPCLLLSLRVTVCSGDFLHEPRNPDNTRLVCCAGAQKLEKKSRKPRHLCIDRATIDRQTDRQTDRPEKKTECAHIRGAPHSQRSLTLTFNTTSPSGLRRYGNEVRSRKFTSVSTFRKPNVWSNAAGSCSSSTESADRADNSLSLSASSARWKSLTCESADESSRDKPRSQHSCDLVHFCLHSDQQRCSRCRPRGHSSHGACLNQSACCASDAPPTDENAAAYAPEPPLPACLHV